MQVSPQSHENWTILKNLTYSEMHIFPLSLVSLELFSENLAQLEHLEGVKSRDWIQKTILKRSAMRMNVGYLWQLTK